MSHWRMLRWLGSSLGLLAIAVDVLLSRSIQVESTELHSSSVYLTVSWHANGLLLVEYATLVARNSTSWSSCLQSRCLESTGLLRADGLRLTLQRCVRCTATSSGSIIPRASSGASGGSRQNRMRVVRELLEVVHCQFVLRGRNRNFGFCKCRRIHCGGLSRLSRCRIGNRGLGLRCGRFGRLLVLRSLDGSAKYVRKGDMRVDKINLLLSRGGSLLWCWRRSSKHACPALLDAVWNNARRDLGGGCRWCFGRSSGPAVVCGLLLLRRS